jgi:hypothetical protein
MTDVLFGGLLFEREIERGLATEDRRKLTKDPNRKYTKENSKELDQRSRGFPLGMGMGTAHCG